MSYHPAHRWSFCTDSVTIVLMLLMSSTGSRQQPCLHVSQHTFGSLKKTDTGFAFVCLILTIIEASKRDPGFCRAWMQTVCVLSLWARMGTGPSIGTFTVHGCTKRSQLKRCLHSTGMRILHFYIHTYMYAKSCEKRIRTIFTVTLMTKCLRRREEGGHQRRSLRILMYQCKDLFKHLLNALSYQSQFELFRKIRV